ncbi:MAG: ABC transporter substrate-binding protein [candidate division NC10 bacterium]|nr:ABC transporter substrate-binding protein [candidate division NC10 bacterium]
MRYVLFGIPLILLVCLCMPLSSSQAAETVRLALGPAGFTLAPVYLAVALGMFEEQGLAVKRISVPGPGLEVRALEGGQADLAFTSGDSLLSTPPGRPLLVVYSGLQRPIVNWVMRGEAARRHGISQGSPLSQKLRALRGLSVGVTAPGSLGERLATYVAAREGLRIGEDIRLISLGRSDGWAAALRDGRVDVGLNLVPLPEMAVVREEAVSLINYARGEDPGLSEFLMGVLLVRTELAQKQEEKVRRATRALYQAVRWALRSPTAKIAGALQPFMVRADSREIAEGVKAILPALNPYGLVTERAFTNTADVVEKAGSLRRRIRFEETVANQFLPG